MPPNGDISIRYPGTSQILTVPESSPSIKAAIRCKSFVHTLAERPMPRSSETSFIYSPLVKAMRTASSLNSSVLLIPIRSSCWFLNFNISNSPFYRYRTNLKNRILLDNYFFPADLEAQIEAFVGHYNHQRYHESINNLTPADVYFGCGQSILKQREKIERKTMETRRLQYRKHAA